MRRCERCGKGFESPQPHKRFCTKSCQQASYQWNYRRKHPERVLASKRKSANKWYKNNVDGYIHVYYLPEEHYIGITHNVKHRMRTHHRNGKMVDGYEVIARFERRVDAIWFEAMFHQRGYIGFRDPCKQG